MNEITYEQRKEIYQRAINKYGKDLQVVVAIEEMSELQKVLCKWFRCEDGCSRYDLIEEIADVAIMLEQLRIMFDINEEVCEMMDSKVGRLDWRIRKEAK